MSLQREVLVASSSSGSSLTVWDLDSGAPLTNLKNNASGRNGLCRVGSDYVAAAQKGKNLIRFWSWEKASPSQESFLPEKVNVITATGDGAYFIGGGQSGAVYVWEIATSCLLRTWPGHYKAVTALALLDGGSVLLTGGEDAIVNVWSLATVLENCHRGRTPVGNPTPLHSWSDHTLPVTSIHCGFGGANAIVISSSMDCSCKVWQAGTGTLLRSISFPAPIVCVSMDQGEHSVYAGSKNGILFEVSLVGVPGQDGKPWRCFTGHSRSITCLAFSGDGSRLASASEDGTVRVWDMQTRQCVKVLDFPSRFPVTAMMVIQDPPMQAIGQRGGRKNNQLKRGILGLNKYTSGPPRGDLNPWDGCPVSIDGSVEYTGIAARCGLLVDSSSKEPALFGTPSVGIISGGGGLDVDKELGETRLGMQRLWATNQKLLEFCEDKISKSFGK
ncbi:hypothetical protein BSKO_04068 [Bryopsis sp. KO-2023]|nr:hypothetical protein BSKO_04068 [Bryopsis sp. KO-2023]